MQQSNIGPELFRDAGIAQGKKVGLVGWKLMAPIYGTPDMFDLPCFIVDAAKKAAGSGVLVNATDLFIHPAYGVRAVNDPDTIAWLEFGAAWAGAAVGKMDRHKR